MEKVEVPPYRDFSPSKEPGGFILTTLTEAVNWSRKNSIWPVTFGTACCAIEMMGSAMARFDISRFGWEVFRPSPRQADLMILSGTITNKMAPVMKTIYDQMPDPKWVIAMGACSCTGGLFDSYAVLQGADSVIPVDIYVPGCPPRPEALIDGILKLQEKIGKAVVL